jgi:hypothetical protein
MIKTLSLLVVFLFLSVNFSFLLPSISYAETVVTEIDSEAAARNLAVKAEGTYVKGAAAPTLSGSEVALPIIDEASGDVLGYIVADQIKLISVLNEAGMAEVASAIAAISVGTAAGAAAGTGFALGTTGTIAAVAAVGIGVAVAVGSGGTSSTPSH